jgi:large subunit ribosomal protein L22
MISKAVVRFVRLSPRKARLVADMVRGKGVSEAQAILSNLHKKASSYVSEVLSSAVANAKIHPEVEPAELYVSKITVDDGPKLKRYRAGSMGRAMRIAHRMSHILVELDVRKERAPVKAVKKRVVAEKKPPAKTKRLTAAKKGK